MKQPLMRKTYATKSGVRVRLTFAEKAMRRGKREWRAFCFRAETGGRHGWIWARNLTEVAS
jgi:hypothetical protein